MDIESLSEFNPMLGFRGCRIGIVYPEITEMQAQAIIEAACQAKATGIKVKPEIMIPLVSHINESKLQEKIYRSVAERLLKQTKIKIDKLV